MDSTLLTFFNQTLAHPLLDPVMVSLTVAGLALLPTLGVILTLKSGHRRVGLAILVSLAAALLLTMLFQFLALRPRPAAVRLLLPAPNFPAYPSGHAALAFGTALVLGLRYRRWRRWVATLLGAGLIALSRLYLGHHYPSDVLGGAILGAAVGAACYGLIVIRPAGLSTWQWLLWPQIALALLVTQMAYLDILPLRLLAIPYIDKFLHFLLIGSIAFWLNIWFRGRNMSMFHWAVPLAILIPLTIALLEEAAQLYSPLRTADLTDLLSDLVGLLFFWWLSQKMIRGELKLPVKIGLF
jgi:membrane-associated phospholipid phosphatase